MFLLRDFLEFKGLKMIFLHNRRLTQKEKEENLFFNFDPVKIKKMRKKREEEERLGKVFNHWFVGNKTFSKNVNNINLSPRSPSKQAVVKRLSSLNARGTKNALSYVIRNSDSNFAINQDGEEVTLEEVMKDWKKDFSEKKNSKESLHMVFSIKENFSDYNINILKECVEEVMKKNFFEYKYVSVLHTHQNNPHIHIILNTNNIYTKKKFHLNQEDFKDFWNNLRQDFTLALNAKGLAYHNAYKIERDLVKEKINIEQNLNNDQHISTLDLAKEEEKIDKKIKLYENKRTQNQKDLRELEKEKNKLFKELAQAESKNWQGKKFATLKKLKECFENIKVLERDIKVYNKDIKVLKTRYRDINATRLEQFRGFVGLQRKKEYLEFLKKNKLSKSSLIEIKEIEREIAFLEKNINEKSFDNFKSSFVITKLLNKKSSSFALIKNYKELEYNLSVLKNLRIEEPLAFAYAKKLVDNQELILGFIEEKYKSLKENLFQTEDIKSIKDYDIKEFKNIIRFLDNENKAQDEFLIKKLEEKLKQKDKPQTQTRKQETSQEEKKEKDTKKEDTQIINDSRQLDALLKQQFIDWLIEKRKITNKKFYENLFAKQLSENKLENFKEYFKEFQNSQRKNFKRT